MDLDFNQGGMPPTSSDNSTPPEPPTTPTPPPTPSAGEPVNISNQPDLPPAQPGQSTAKPIDNIDVPSPETGTEMPPPPPVPPAPDLTENPNPEEQYIETPNSQPHKSLVLPIIVAVLVLLIIVAVVALGLYYTKMGPNAPANTDNIALDPATGQPVDNSQTNMYTNNPIQTPVTNDLTTVKGRDSQRKADLATIQSYLENYKSQNGAYPISVDPVKLNEPNTVVNALVPTYASSLPIDPSGSTSYYGYTSADGSSYKLTTSLEDLSDPTGVQAGNYNIYTVTNMSPDTSSNPDPSSSSVTTNPQSDSINSDFSSSSSSSASTN